MLAAGISVIWSMSARFMGGRSGRLPEGMSIPNFKLDYIAGGEGSLNFGDLRGKGVMLNFWATWCGPCRAELPALKALHAKYAGEHFILLGVGDESPAKVRAFAKRPNVALNYPLVSDRRGSLARKLKVNGIPFTVFIGPDGKVVGDISGGLSESEGAERIEALIVLAKDYPKK